MMTRNRFAHVGSAFAVGAASLGFLAGQAGAGPHDGDGGGADFGGFTIYTTACRTENLDQLCQSLGILQVPLIHKFRFFDIENDRLDLEQYQERIWTPGVPEERAVCLNFPFGIPAGWSSWVDLDFEEWMPIRFPENYPPEVIERRVQEYKDLINATRHLRPTAKVALHSMLRADATRFPRTAAMEAEIAALCDATSPSMYVKHGQFASDWATEAVVLRRCLEVKAATGLEVYPIVWKRYRDTLDMMPEDLQRLQVRSILELEHQGQRVDGLFIFVMMDEDEPTELAYHQLVAEIAAEVAGALADDDEDDDETDAAVPRSTIVELRNATDGKYD